MTDDLNKTLEILNSSNTFSHGDTVMLLDALEQIEKINAELQQGIYGMEKKICPRCENNLATNSHMCPYQQEINDDTDFECICCDDCRREFCLEEI